LRVRTTFREKNGEEKVTRTMHHTPDTYSGWITLYWRAY